MKLTDKIHLLKIDFEISLSPEKKLPRFVNILIIFGKKITLIDTGVKGSEEKIFAYIEKNNRKISDIETVILSHSHPDHIGAVAKIWEQTQCTVCAYKEEIEWIEDIELQNNERPVPGFFSLVDSPVDVNKILQHNETLNADDNVSLKIIHSPGHSKGSLSILFPEDKILFTADAIPLKNDIPNYDNYFDLMKTLKTIRDNADYNMLLTSWTPPLTTREEIKNIIQEGEAYMLKIDDIVKPLYNEKEPEPLVHCKTAIHKLGLPLFLVTPLVDKAFRSHKANMK